METRKRYRKKEGQFVTAVRLDLDFDGLTYRKWGADQRCKPGDWLVKVSVSHRRYRADAVPVRLASAPVGDVVVRLSRKR